MSPCPCKAQPSTHPAAPLAVVFTELRAPLRGRGAGRGAGQERVQSRSHPRGADALAAGPRPPSLPPAPVQPPVTQRCLPGPLSCPAVLGSHRTWSWGRGRLKTKLRPLCPPPQELSRCSPCCLGCGRPPGHARGRGRRPLVAFFFFSWKKQELRSRLPSWDCGPVALAPPPLSPWPYWGIRQHPEPRAAPRGWRHRSVWWLPEPCGHRCPCWRGTGVLGTG